MAEDTVQSTSYITVRTFGTVITRDVTLRRRLGARQTGGANGSTLTITVATWRAARAIGSSGCLPELTGGAQLAGFGTSLHAERARQASGAPGLSI